MSQMYTYGDIRTEFLALLNRRDCTTALADGFLQQALQRAQRVMRVPAMEVSVAIALNNDNYFLTGSLQIPLDFIQLRGLFYTSQSGMVWELAHENLDYVTQIATGATTLVGSSKYFARQAGAWVLAPVPQAGDIVRIDYWAEFPDLLNITDDTVLSNTAKDLMTDGGMVRACKKWTDKRHDLFEASFTQTLSDLQDQADRDELSAAVVAQAFSYPSDR